MATNYVYLAGTVKWAKVFRTNIDEYNGDKFWSVEFYPDGHSLKEFQKSGSRLKIHNTEDGIAIRLRRPLEKLINKELVTFDPPDILDEHGQPWVVDEDGAPEKLIGNGSDVTVKIAVYDTKQGKGTRFEGLRVDRLVEYAGGGGDQLATINVRTNPTVNDAEMPF